MTFSAYCWWSKACPTFVMMMKILWLGMTNMCKHGILWQESSITFFKKNGTWEQRWPHHDPSLLKLWSLYFFASFHLLWDASGRESPLCYLNLQEVLHSQGHLPKWIKVISTFTRQRCMILTDSDVTLRLWKTDVVKNPLQRAKSFFGEETRIENVKGPGKLGQTKKQRRTGLISIWWSKQACPIMT